MQQPAALRSQLMRAVVKGATTPKNFQLQFSRLCLWKNSSLCASFCEGMKLHVLMFDNVNFGAFQITPGGDWYSKSRTLMKNTRIAEHRPSIAIQKCVHPNQLVHITTNKTTYNHLKDGWMFGFTNQPTCIQGSQSCQQWLQCHLVAWRDGWQLVWC